MISARAVQPEQQRSRKSPSTRRDWIVDSLSIKLMRGATMPSATASSPEPQLKNISSCRWFQVMTVVITNTGAGWNWASSHSPRPRYILILINLAVT